MKKGESLVNEEFETVPYWALIQRLASAFYKLDIIDDEPCFNAFTAHNDSEGAFLMYVDVEGAI